MPKLAVFALVTFFHDLFTVIWVGGLICLGVVVLPAARRVLGMGPETKRLMDAIQSRLSVLVYVSIVGLLVTGVLLANRAPGFVGLFRFGDPYSAVLSAKHLLVLAMVATALLRSHALKRRGTDLGPRQERVKMALLFVNMALGILVLLLTGFSVALSSVGSMAG